jgi:hypothetical protein
MITILSLGLGLFAVPLAAGFSAGYVGHRRWGLTASLLIMAILLTIYGCLMLYQGLWALSDWNGSVDGDNILNPLGLYNEDGRQEFLRLTALIFAIPTGLAIAGSWAAALVARRPVPAA